MDPPPQPEPVSELRRGRLWRRSVPPSTASKRPSSSAAPSSAAVPSSPQNPNPSSNPNPNHNLNPFFSCNICLDPAKEPVVTHCGHLFCWRCLYRWVYFHSTARDCPLCKAPVEVPPGSLAVVPIYGPDSADTLATADGVPPRPAGRRASSSPVSEMIEEVRQTAEMIGAHVQLQALRRTTSVIDRVLVSLQAIEELVEKLRGIHRETRREVGRDVEEDGVYRRTRGRRETGRDAAEDGVYRRTRRRLAEER